MKIVYNKIIPFGRKYYCINLFGLLFAKGPCDRVMINHEKIHSCQMRELGYVPFYIIYVVEWIYKLIKYRDSYKAYRNISFEKEAYNNEANLNYLTSRRHYAWRHQL